VSQERHRAELGAVVQEKLEAKRQEATRGIEHLRSWLGEDVQRRLDAGRAEAARGLESVRAELALIGRLQTTREENRAEVAAEALLATFDLLDAVQRAAKAFVLKSAQNVVGIVGQVDPGPRGPPDEPL
jgi:hypothetical protein